VVSCVAYAVKRNAQGRRRDKHKKHEQDASEAAAAEEPELQPVDEETLRREREEAQRRWREEQRKKYPVAPDGMIRLCLGGCIGWELDAWSKGRWFDSRPASQLSLSSLQGRLIEYRPAGLGLGGARSLVSGGR